MSNETDVSGFWTGAYSYLPSLQTVEFTAILQDVLGTRSGVTEEPAPRRLAPLQRRTAMIQGRRTHWQLVWIKRYDVPTDAGYASAIVYEGTLSGDGLEIHGTWTIPGSISGSFLMIRAGGREAARERETAAQER